MVVHCLTCQGTGREIVEKVKSAPQNYDRFAEPIYYEEEVECEECEGSGVNSAPPL